VEQKSRLLYSNGEWTETHVSENLVAPMVAWLSVTEPCEPWQVDPVVNDWPWQLREELKSFYVHLGDYVL
jgi:hypothetical protein